MRPSETKPYYMDETTVVRGWHVTQWGDGDDKWSLGVWEQRVMGTMPGETGYGVAADPTEALRGTKDVVVARLLELLA